MDYEIEILPEICCDMCNNVIHSHFDECPLCHVQFASTSLYGESWDMKVGESARCMECGEAFILVKREGHMAWTFERGGADDLVGFVGGQLKDCLLGKISTPKDVEED